MICKNCGAENKKDAHFCGSCGSAIVDCDSQSSNKSNEDEHLDPSDNRMVYMGFTLVGIGAVGVIGTLFGALFLDFSRFYFAIFGVIIAIGWGCVRFVFNKNENKVIQEKVNHLAAGTISSASVLTALANLGAYQKSEYVVPFGSDSDHNAVCGLKLDKDESPIVLFGTNSRVGVISATGWCGVLFSNKRLHYKIVKVYKNPIMIFIASVFNLQDVTIGVIAYSDVKSIGLIADGAYLVANGKLLGRFQTSKEGSDPDAIAALDSFCKIAVRAM